MYNVDTSRHGSALFDLDRKSLARPLDNLSLSFQTFPNIFISFRLTIYLLVAISFYMSDHNPLTIFPQFLIKELGRITGMF